MTDSGKEINAGNYSIHIGQDSLSRLNEYLKEKYKGRTKYILVDENSLNYCLPLINEHVDQLHQAEILEVESGEEHKNIEVSVQIWHALSKLQADRNSVLVNLGGGLICDIGGFVAATFKRGIDFINVPTTLLSQVDAAFGGKTGIDLDQIKNQVGVFCNPGGVFVYPGFLNTLTKRQLLAGFAEVIKYGLIADRQYLDELKAIDFSDFDSWSLLLQRSVEIKLGIVNQDYNDSGIRRKLNFGHTIGHALESYSLDSDNPLLHGEAIAIGMICEAYLSRKILNLKKEEFDEAKEIISRHFAPYPLNRSAYDQLIGFMRNDKKNQDDYINFTLLSGIGKAEINQVCDDYRIIEALEYYRKNVKPVVAQS